MSDNDKPKTTIKLGPCLGSYANIFKPRAVNEGDEPKYSISLLFPKNPKTDREKRAAKSLDELKKLVDFVAKQKFGPQYAKIKGFHLPFRDGDVEKPEQKEYAGKIFVNSSSTRAPGVVDRNLVAIMSESEAYSGCYFVASVNVYPFEKKAKKGIALGLNNLLVIEKGEKLGGGKEAAEDFKGYEDEESGAAATGTDDSPLD